MMDFRQNSILLNSFICDVEISWQGHDLPTSVSNRVILPLCEDFIFTKLSKVSRK